MEGSVVRAVFCVVGVVFADGGTVAAGEFLGFFPDRGADVGSRCPASVGADLADSRAVVAEVPVRSSFEVAVTLASVQLHVVAVRAEVHFECFGVTHFLFLLKYKISNNRYCLFLIYHIIYFMSIVKGENVL